MAYIITEKLLCNYMFQVKFARNTLGTLDNFQ
jgi:hypothetical protein